MTGSASPPSAIAHQEDQAITHQRDQQFEALRQKHIRDEIVVCRITQLPRKFGQWTTSTVCHKNYTFYQDAMIAINNPVLPTLTMPL